jgi:tRNA (guanine37-N1)-methyltransferase
MGRGLVMRFDCVTLFPQMFAAVTDFGITRRAREEGRWSLALWNPRDHATDVHRTVDDRPYGGGPGMLMMPGPLVAAIEALRADASDVPVRVVHLSPQGRVLDDAKVRELATLPRVALVCGRYEGIDERIVRRCVDEELSVGDYVLSGGELAAMVVIDAVVRQLPGVLGDAQSAAQDSFVAGLLDCPHYTRPEMFAGERVPEVLLSGHHADIERWRLKQSLGRTWERRPELLARRALSAQEQRLLAEYREERRQGPGGA